MTSVVENQLNKADTVSFDSPNTRRSGYEMTMEGLAQGIGNHQRCSVTADLEVGKLEHFSMKREESCAADKFSKRLPFNFCVLHPQSINEKK